MDTVLLFTSFFLRDPLVVATFGIVTIAGFLALIPWMRRRRNAAALLAMAAAASVALIVSFTWLPGSGGLAALDPDCGARAGFCWRSVDPSVSALGCTERTVR